MWLWRSRLWGRQAGDSIRGLCSGSGHEPSHRQTVRQQLRVPWIDRECLDSGAGGIRSPNHHKVEHENQEDDPF